MRVTMDFSGFDKELTAMAASDNLSVEKMIYRLVLERLHIYMLGVIAGNKESAKVTLEAIDKAFEGGRT